jgi:hypothetical protein
MGAYPSTPDVLGPTGLNLEEWVRTADCVFFIYTRENNKLGLRNDFLEHLPYGINHALIGRKAGSLIFGSRATTNNQP